METELTSLATVATPPSLSPPTTKYVVETTQELLHDQINENVRDSLVEQAHDQYVPPIKVVYYDVNINTWFSAVMYWSMRQ